jgi:hypothetical protein
MENPGRFTLRTGQRQDSDQPTREFRMLLDETKFVTKGVRAVKTTFSPRLRFNRPKDGASGRSAHSPEVFLEIVHCEVQVVRVGFSVPRITISPRIEAGKDDGATTEIMTSGRDAASWLAKDSRVKDGGVLDAGYRNDNAI